MQLKRLLSSNIFYSILLSLLVFGCVDTPNTPTKKAQLYDTLSTPFPESGIIVLCEGLWNYNNSDIYVYNNSTGKTLSSYFKTATGKYLGDIVSDMKVLEDGRIIFTATGTKELILLDYKVPAITSKITIPYDRAAPRSLTTIGDKYYYTDLYRDELRSGIIGDTLSTPNQVFTTGPAPEDIIAHNGKLYIANSGFGDYRKEVKNAGTLQILDPNTGKSEYIYIGPNLIQLSINRTENYIACGYLNTPSAVEKGELGGIKFVDLMTNKILREMPLKDFSDVVLSESTGAIYYLSEGGLYVFPHINSRAIPQLIYENTTKDVWPSLSIDDAKNEIWIGNARNFQRDGEVIIISTDGTLLRTIQVGKNPRKVVGY
ncbi:MAG: hypothetical protein CVV25_09650 [Ignavibacteriae bacterium HGW-Ignavibacteriae-4]|jgi:hypothetical protein|nr:MAG: hypothetical protein CVV25_09650 [Ignavibacteriae bacterium HGW-Ignavibacteriae-4]